MCFWKSNCVLQTSYLLKSFRRIYYWKDFILKVNKYFHTSLPNSHVKLSRIHQFCKREKISFTYLAIVCQLLPLGQGALSLLFPTLRVPPSFCVHPNNVNCFSSAMKNLGKPIQSSWLSSHWWPYQSLGVVTLLQSISYWINR